METTALTEKKRLESDLIKAGAKSVQVEGGRLIVNITRVDVRDDILNLLAATAKCHFNIRKVDAQQAQPHTEVLSSNRSFASAPHSIAAALKMLTKVLGPDLKWTMPSNESESFLQELPRLMQEVEDAADIISGCAQRGGVDEVNRFLEEKGFSIQLDPIGPDEVAAAGVLDIGVKWKVPGNAIKLRVPSADKDVDAVHVKREKAFYSVAGHKDPIVELETQSQDRVFMTKYEGDIPTDELGLRQFVLQLSRSKQQRRGHENQGVKFPMVDFEDQGDIEWLKGASASGAEDGLPVIIQQAKYQHRLRMNEIGARAQAAAAVSAMRGMTPPPLVIDGNFLVWFERGEEKDPSVFFGAYIKDKHMKRPMDLD